MSHTTDRNAAAIKQALLINARITSKSIFLGDVDLCDVCHIAERGVTVIPGRGDDFNRVIVEFLVGTIEAEDGVL